MLNPSLNAAFHDGEIDSGDVTQCEGGVGRQPLSFLLPQRHQLVQHVVRLNPRGYKEMSSMFADQ